ncbi:MAG: LON peptidase substrate-binding domain-containing protein [Armatimonadaceae bacterium]
MRAKFGQAERVFRVERENNEKQNTSDGVTEIPLFPLDVVLFPNMILPLHIFEERYKEMIQRCVHESLPFGVVLIKEVNEATGRVTTHPVGCTARIARVEKLPDGRMNIEVIGEQRFRILDTHEQMSYRTGLTEPYTDTPVDTGEIEPLTGEVHDLLYEFLMRSLAIMGQEVGDFELPRDGQKLAFTAACVLPLPNPQKQELLSDRNPADRLQTVRGLLAKENERLREITETVWQPVATSQYDDYRSAN